MLTQQDQKFLIQMVGYTTGVATATVSAMYIGYRSIKGMEKLAMFAIVRMTKKAK